MIKLLGRQTSGNVQKVLFLLEELRIPYVREDYGRQFGNTLTDAYRALNPNAKVPTMIDGDLVIWESNTILRYLAALHAPALHGAAPGERTLVERWMDWVLASLNAPYVAVFKDARTAPEARAVDFAEQSKTLVEQLKILDGPSRQARVVRARQAHARRGRARPDRQALPRIPDRAPCPSGAGEMAGRHRHAAGLPGGDRRQAERRGDRRMRRRDARALPSFGFMAAAGAMMLAGGAA